MLESSSTDATLRRCAYKERHTKRFTVEGKACLPHDLPDEENAEAALNTRPGSLWERSVLSKQLRLEPAQLTDVGRKRPHNEDNMAYVIPKDPVAMARKGALFIVADGMGGHAAGEVASEIAVDTVSKAYYQDDSDDVLTSLVYAIKRANTLIHQRAAENMLSSGMGTTCVAAVLRGSTAYIANVGDSRAYFIHNGQVRQVSQDHSWVAEQVRAGLLTNDQARSHAQRNVITRSLGTQPDVEIDTFAEHLEIGDFVVLCSDGLSGLITDSDLLAIVSQYQPQESVYHLVERANENGGPDNITVIVARIQEVGWEPPNTNATDLSGRSNQEAEATMPLPLPGMPVGSIGSTRRNDNGWMGGPQFRLPSGPLATTEAFPQTPPLLPPKTRKRRRLLYPTLALFIILVIVMVVGGAYYLIQNNVTGTAISHASSLLNQANAEKQSTPADALKKLATVQMLLRTVHPSALNTSQSTELSALQNSFVTTTKAAITNYTTQANITTLPCTTTVTNALNTGSTNTQAVAIAALTNSKGTSTSSLFALGNDGHLYQITPEHSLVNLMNTPTGIQKLASDGSRLLALTATTGAKPTYSLHLLLFAHNGLQDANATTINTSVTQQDGSIPSFVTAWGADVYVVLTSMAAPNNAYILAYTINNNNKLTAGTVTKISISNAIQSVSAFPNHQLFFLYSDGSVQSWTSGSQAGVSVVVQQPIPIPLSINAQTFTLTTPVPQVAAPSSVFLMLPRATFLIAGSVNAMPHLYLIDSMYHRILDLQAVSSPTTKTTTATPTTTPTGTNSPGGGVATTSNQMKMQLNHQYTSTTVLANTQNAVADPQQPTLYLLTQIGQQTVMQNIVAVDVSQNGTCTP